MFPIIVELWKVYQIHYKHYNKVCFHFSNWNILPPVVIVKILFMIQVGLVDNRLNYRITEKQLIASLGSLQPLLASYFQYVQIRVDKSLFSLSLHYSRLIICSSSTTTTTRNTITLTVTMITMTMITMSSISTSLTTTSSTTISLITSTTITLMALTNRLCVNNFLDQQKTLMKLIQH